VDKGRGVKGIKFHPFYHDFYLAEDRMMALFETRVRGEAGIAREHVSCREMRRGEHGDSLGRVLSYNEKENRGNA
jgi:hypothetical protein